MVEEVLSGKKHEDKYDDKNMKITSKDMDALSGPEIYLIDSDRSKSGWVAVGIHSVVIIPKNQKFIGIIVYIFLCPIEVKIMKIGWKRPAIWK